MEVEREYIRSKEATVRLLTVEKLAEMGISIGHTSTITLQNKEFHIGPTFSLKMRAAAIGFCEQEERQGTKCLLIENATALTVWTYIPPASTEKIGSDLKKKEFIKRCHQELTKCIGPMATLIVDELVNGEESLKSSQLIERIIEQIPDPKLAAEFRRNLQD
jgi:hypothetical protein